MEGRDLRGPKRAILGYTSRAEKSPGSPDLVVLNLAAVKITCRAFKKRQRVRSTLGQLNLNLQGVEPDHFYFLNLPI